MYSYGSPHMAAQKQDDQLERTFSSYVRIQDVVLKTYLGRWTIGRSGERGSGISVLPTRYDDDDDDDYLLVCIRLLSFSMHIYTTFFYSYIYIYIYTIFLYAYTRGAYDKFSAFFRMGTLLIVHIWNSSPLQSNLLWLQCTCTVPTTSGRPRGSPLVWVC